MLFRSGWSRIQSAGDEGLSLEAAGQARAPGHDGGLYPRGRLSTERTCRTEAARPWVPPPPEGVPFSRCGPPAVWGGDGTRPRPIPAPAPCGAVGAGGPGEWVLLGQCLFCPRSSLGVGGPGPARAPRPAPVDSRSTACSPALGPPHRGSHGSGCGEAAHRVSPGGPGEQGPSGVAALQALLRPQSWCWWPCLLLAACLLPAPVSLGVQGHLRPWISRAPIPAGHLGLLGAPETC